jgi:RNA polymerase sigma-70 factor (ECF subfamily)
LQNVRPLEYDISPVDLSLLQKLDLEELQHIIDKLSPGRRQIFIAHAIDGLTHKEIAKQLKISEGTSKSQFFDARKEIKWALENNVMIAKRKA